MWGAEGEDCRSRPVNDKMDTWKWDCLKEMGEACNFGAV